MARGSNRRHVKGPSQSPIQPSSNSNVDNAWLPRVQAMFRLIRTLNCSRSLLPTFNDNS
jgi:hypothetical protein